MAQIDSAEQMVSGLGTTGRQFQTLQVLIVVKQDSLGAADNLSLAALGNDIHSIASPNINGNNAIQLVIQSNSSGLGVGSAAGNISLSFQVCQRSGGRSNAGESSQSIQIGSSQGLLNILFIQADVVVQDSLVAGIPQLTLVFSQLTLDNNFGSGIGQVHSGTLDGLDDAGHAVHDIAAFALGNCDCVMHHLIIIGDNSVLGARVIDHLVITSDKQFLTNGMDNLITFLIDVLVFSNYLDVNAGNLG